MWKPLTIISGVILGAAGGFNYVKIRPQFLAEAEHRKNANDSREVVRNGLKAAEQRKEEAEKQQKDIESTIVTREAEKVKAAEALAAAKKMLEEKVKEQEAVQLALDEQKKKIKDYGEVEVMAAELKSLQEKAANLAKQAEDTKAATAATVAHKAQTDKDIAALQQRQLFQQTGIMDGAFTTSVAAVNPDFGFVMLPAGNNRNVVRKAKLEVKRGDAVIGKLVVTNVNPSRAIAEIVPGSVASGDSILPGDKVVVDAASRPESLQKAKESSTAKPAADGEKKEDAPAAETPAADPFAAPAAGTDPTAPAAETPAADAAPAVEGTTPAAEGTAPAAEMNN